MSALGYGWRCADASGGFRCRRTPAARITLIDCGGANRAAARCRRNGARDDRPDVHAAEMTGAMRCFMRRPSTMSRRGGNSAPRSGRSRQFSTSSARMFVALEQARSLTIKARRVVWDATMPDSSAPRGHQGLASPMRRKSWPKKRSSCNGGSVGVTNELPVGRGPDHVPRALPGGAGEARRGSRHDGQSPLTRAP